MNLGIDTGILIVGLFVGMLVSEAFSRPMSDEEKWERFYKNREERRLIERRYEACAFECRERCGK